MTIAVETNRISYAGNGGTVAFAVPFPFHAQGDLVVLAITDSTGLETAQVLTTDYTISGSQDTLTHYPNGGTVTMTTAPASGVTLTIYRDPPVIQSADLVENDNLPAESVEAEFDYVTMLIQRIADLASRSLRQTDGDSPDIGALPNILLRANKYLAFDSSGDPEAVDAATASGTSVTAAGTPTARLLSAWMADVGNPYAWGATGDGTTSDQTALVNLFADAYSGGYGVFVPDGVFLSTATIPHFHDVVKFGPGLIKRGSDFFAVDPSKNPGATNRFYVATTGVDTNDGLTSSQPFLTVQAAGDTLYKYSYGDVTWKIVHAAGTYPPSSFGSFTRPFPTPNRVQWLGPVKATGTAPTAIFQGTGGVLENGLYVQNYIRAQVEDIWFKRCRTAGSVNGSGFSSGINADGRCDLYTRNVWTDECDAGIRHSNGTQGRIEGGRHGSVTVNAVDIDFLRHCEGSVSYNSSAADPLGITGTALKGSVNGIRAQEFSMVHADFCYFDGNTTGAILTNGSRIDSISSVYNTCALGIDARINSIIGITGNTFTSCTNDMILRSGSRFAGTTISEATDIGPPVLEIDAVGGTTQSATPVSVYSKDFAAKELQTRGAGFILTLTCAVTGTTDTKTVVVAFGGTTLLTATIASGTLAYKIIVELVQVTAASAQKVYTRILQTGADEVAAYTATAIDLTAAKTLSVTHQVTNTADLNRVAFTKLEITH